MTRPCLTERLLMGRKESNQTNKKHKYNIIEIGSDSKPFGLFWSFPNIIQVDFTMFVNGMRSLNTLDR